MDLIDTHAHLTYPPLDEQIEAVLARSRDAGVTGWITVGTGPDENPAALKLAQQHERMWAALGIHPHNADGVTDEHLSELSDLARDSKVVAIGETGLDYHYMHSTRENQQRVFRAQLDIAAALGKPAVIHTREAFDDSLSILAEYDGRLSGVVIHCYGGNPDQTREVLRRGYFVSFTGTVTFKKTDDVRQVAAMIPTDRLMIETDCPYLSPEPVRRVQPNEPALLVHIAAKLAELHNMPLGQFAQTAAKNSIKFFNLNKKEH
jgi:TatD DNase family protein